MRASSPTRRRNQARGFTLVELMIVVVVVAVLATLASYGVMNYVRSSKTSEALNMIAAIKAAQESYKSETFTYLDVSQSGSLDDMSSFYPTTKPGNFKTSWGAGDGKVAVAWRTLGVTSSAPLYFVYGCAAGPGSVKPAAPGMTVDNWPDSPTGEPWYVVKAVGDLDGDEQTSLFVSASFTAGIFQKDEIE